MVRFGSIKYVGEDVGPHRSLISDTVVVSFNIQFSIIRRFLEGSSSIGEKDSYEGVLLRPLVWWVF